MRKEDMKDFHYCKIRKKEHTGTLKRHKCSSCGSVKYEVYMQIVGVGLNNKEKWRCMPACHSGHGFPGNKKRTKSE